MPKESNSDRREILESVAQHMGIFQLENLVEIDAMTQDGTRKYKKTVVDVISKSNGKQYRLILKSGTVNQLKGWREINPSLHSFTWLLKEDGTKVLTEIK